MTSRCRWTRSSCRKARPTRRASYLRRRCATGFTWSYSLSAKGKVDDWVRGSFITSIMKGSIPLIVCRDAQDPRYGELESSTHGSQVPLPETVWNCARWLIPWGNTSRFAHVQSLAQRSAWTRSFFTRRGSTNKYDVTSYSQATNSDVRRATFAMLVPGPTLLVLSMGSACQGTVYANSVLLGFTTVILLAINWNSIWSVIDGNTSLGNLKYFLFFS